MSLPYVVYMVWKRICNVMETLIKASAHIALSDFQANCLKKPNKY